MVVSMGQYKLVKLMIEKDMNGIILVNKYKI